MSTRITRALLLSFGIALLITAVYYWFLNESDLKKRIPKQVYYPARIDFHIAVSDGTAAAKDVRMTRVVLEDRLKRMNWKYTLNETGNNNFRLSIDRVADTNSVAELLTGNGNLELLEAYTWLDLQKSLEAANRLLQGKDTTEVSKYRLFRWLQPASPYQDGRGGTSYPGYIGIVRMEDTSQLRRLLDSPAIKQFWPADARFLFGADISRPGSEKITDLYAVRDKEPRLTNRNIVMARPDQGIDKGSQVFFQFDAYGAIAWERMTEHNIGKPIAICLGGRVMTAPTVNGAIHGGACVLTMGPASFEYCQAISILLTNKELLQPVQVTKTHFAAAQRPPKPVVTYILLFLLSFALALGIQLLLFRLSKT